MPQAPKVIHQYGRPMKAKMPNGDVIDRQDKIFVPSYHATYPCLDYDNHFVFYYDRDIGSTLRCTCGGISAVFSYSAYSKYCSYMGEKVIGCISHLQTGKHDDGSS